MEKFSMEKSEEASLPLKEMNRLALELDVEYLSAALKRMRESHSMRESMAILNPSPFTHNAQQDLNEVKLEQLELMLKLAENAKRIIRCQAELMKAKSSSADLGRMFGI